MAPQLFGLDENPILPGIGIFCDGAGNLHIQESPLNSAPFHDDNPHMLGYPGGAQDALALLDLPAQSQAQSVFERSKRIATARNSRICLAGGHSEPIALS
jgi:hypothetical protein